MTPRRPRPRPAAPSAPRRRSPWLGLDRQLCFALYAASLTMTKAYRPLLESLGLTYPQYLVMLALWDRDDQTVGELGQALVLDSGTLTPLLKRMATQGLIERSRDDRDERRVRIRLSAAGQALEASAAAVPQAMFTSLPCSADEVRALTERLTQLRRQLQASEPVRAAQAAAASSPVTAAARRRSPPSPLPRTAA